MNNGRSIMKKVLVAATISLGLVASGATAAVAHDDAKSSEPGTITGQVRTYGGASIADVVVWITRTGGGDKHSNKGGSGATEKVRTDASGEFEETVKPGTYSVWVSDPDKDYASSTKASTVEVGKGEIVEVNKRLHQGGSITGRVTAENGDAVEGLLVYVGRDFGDKKHGKRGGNGDNSWERDGFDYEARGFTDSTGAYSIKGLHEGDYRVFFSSDFAGKDRDGSTVPEWYDNVGDARDARTVDVNYGEKDTGISASVASAR
jgi:hypothetical protein